VYRSSIIEPTPTSELGQLCCVVPPWDINRQTSTVLGRNHIKRRRPQAPITTDRIKCWALRCRCRLVGCHKKHESRSWQCTSRHLLAHMELQDDQQPYNAPYNYAQLPPELLQVCPAASTAFACVSRVPGTVADKVALNQHHTHISTAGTAGVACCSAGACLLLTTGHPVHCV
jgi:hypothetical protein